MDVKKIKDDQQYRVELTERVEVIGNVLSPEQDVVLRGDLVKQFAANIATATPVEG